jgi:NADH-quinone oxidoreductase subunit N
VNIHELVNTLLIDTKESLRFFLPELTLCAAIVLMLLVRVFNWGRRIDAFYFALAGSIVALYFTAPWIHLHDVTAAGAVTRTEIFTGMLVVDTFTVFVRSILFLFAVLFVLFMKLSGMPDREDSADVYTLVLGATLGMCLMASANHLLMVFLAVEMASVPSYALAGMLKGHKLGSEAALKYSIYGAGTAGVMLYGISLVAGLLNTAHLPTLAARLAEKLNAGMPGEEKLVLVFAGLMIMVGLAFKLSAVPFHFWCPDVFEGATAEVNAFLSVASKAAALALLVRVAIGFGALPPADESHPIVAAAPAQTEAERVVMVAYVASEHAAPEPAHTTSADNAGQSPMKALSPARDFIGKLIAFFAVITCTFGNFAAYGQTNIKRLMAYSTIAHAGYMMMAVPAVMAMAGLNPEAAQKAVAALCIYLGVYLFMNLAAFAIIAFLRNAMHSEEIADYAGLIRRNSGITVCMAVTLFSLIGMPPLAGFVGKFAVFAALVNGYQTTGATYLLVVLVIGGLNTVVSLFYYLRVIKVMTIDPEPQDRPPFKFSDVSLQGAYVWLVTAPTVILFFFWNDLNEWALTAARHLLS